MKRACESFVEVPEEPEDRRLAMKRACESFVEVPEKENDDRRDAMKMACQPVPEADEADEGTAGPVDCAAAVPVMDPKKQREALLNIFTPPDRSDTFVESRAPAGQQEKGDDGAEGSAIALC